MKSYTNLEQSKKLAKILPIESADMYYFVADSLEKQEINYAIRCGTPIVKTDIPAWSLAALLNVLPQIGGIKPVLDLETNCIQYPSDIELNVTADNPVDACYEIIIRLDELNLLGL